MDLHQRTTLPFDCLGMNVSSPVDRLPVGKYRLLENTRADSRGKIIGRLGELALSQQLTGGATHSLHAWNDPVPSPSDFPTAYSAHARLAGVGTNLYGAQSKTGINNFGTLVEGSFSGNPLSFVTVPSDFTPRPWVLIGDSAKMRKDSSETFKAYHIGIAPPNQAPILSLGALDTNGPDIGATGQPYVYAFRARADSKLNTNCVSDLGPAVLKQFGESPTTAPGGGGAQDIIVTNGAYIHPDPQVAWLDVFRFGGSLTEWKYVGTMPNVANSIVTDFFNDLALAGNLSTFYGENPQPFVTTDNSKNGTCTVSWLGPGSLPVFQWVSGDQLRPYDATGDAPYYPLGTQISINGTLFTFQESPPIATAVHLVENPPASLVGPVVPFQIISPEMWKTPLPALWGPYGGGETGIFVFGCGNALNSGDFYWTKGNHPESHPATNVLTVTSGSETAMNGCIYGGESYGFTTNRLFRFYPTLGQVTDFIAIEVPNSKGLFARWGLCVTPHGIAFISKDGIYLTAGGPPVSLTDNDLYPLFPHEGIGLAVANFPVIDGLNGTSFSPPDFIQPNAMRLSYGDGFLHFDYIDQDGTRRTLVYDFAAAGSPSSAWSTGSSSNGWVSRDTFAHPVASHYFEVQQDSTTQANNFSQFLMGTTDGYVATFTGALDFGSAINGHIRTGSFDKQDARPRHLWSDIEIDLDTQCDIIDVKVGIDNFSYFTNVTANGLNFTGRRRAILDLNAGQGQYGYNIGLDITWSDASGSRPYLYFWGPSWLPKPELSALRFTGWDDLGYPGAKFIQGFKLRADTLNVARVVEVLDDFNVAHPFTPSAVQHPREQTIAYSFNTPFISHLVRFAPQDAQFWRIEGVEWIFTIAPELVTTYTTQEMTHAINGWGAHRDAYIALISQAQVNFSVNAIGNPLSPFTYAIPTSGLLFDKPYLSLQAMKARAWSYSLTSSAGFRLFTLQSEVRVKEWGSTGRFLSKMPFGEQSTVPAPARI